MTLELAMNNREIRQPYQRSERIALLDDALDRRDLWSRVEDDYALGVKR